jgi:predicted nucleic acid-binding protein
VDQKVILETTFLVDLERELARGSAGPVQAFLAAHENAIAYDIPLATRNRRHFRRVPGLELASYGEDETSPS